MGAGGEFGYPTTAPSTSPPRTPAPRTPPQQGLRGVIPPNFPYLHVEFGLSEGFVHVVDEDEDHKFDTSLARSVMIGEAATWGGGGVGRGRGDCGTG